MPDTQTGEHDSWVHRVFGVHPGGTAAEPSLLSSAGGFLRGVGEGVFDGAKDMVVGVYDLGKSAVKEGYALATDAQERERVGGAVKHGAAAVGSFAEKAVTRPSEALDDVKHAAHKGAKIAGQIADKVGQDYAAAKASGHGAEFVGRGVGEAAVLIGSFFIPGGGEAKAATAAAEAAKAAEAAAALADAAKAAEAAAAVGDAAKAAEAAAAVADAAKAAEGAAATLAKGVDAAGAAADAGKASDAANLAKAEGGVAKGSAEAAAPIDAAAADAEAVEKAAKALKVAERVGPPNPPRDFAAVKASRPVDFEGASTFQPKGMSEQAFNSFLETPEGKEIYRLAVADPKKDVRMVARLKSMLMSGAEEAPKLEKCATPLVKIVPKGNEVGKFSAFFGTQENLNKAVQSGKNLAEFFGLPASSEAAEYDIYMILPKGEQAVVVNTVAPTVEFEGAIEHAGGAIQHLIVDRSQWSAPKWVGRVTN